MYVYIHTYIVCACSIGTDVYPSDHRITLKRILSCIYINPPPLPAKEGHVLRAFPARATPSAYLYTIGAYYIITYIVRVYIYIYINYYAPALSAPRGIVRCA